MISDLDALKSALEQQGWDGLAGDDGSAARAADIDRQVREEARRQAALFLATFDTPAGREVLVLLRQRTIDRPPTQAELDERDPAAAGLAAARRIGANNLMFHVLAMLDMARGLKPTEATNVA